MKKELYEKPILEIVLFAQDVLSASTDTPTQIGPSTDPGMENIFGGFSSGNGFSFW